MPDRWVSSCCRAGMYVRGTVTMHYECAACGLPCEGTPGGEGRELAEMFQRTVGEDEQAS